MKPPAFWNRPAGLTAKLLSPLSVFYTAATARRVQKPALYEAKAHVISVGNLNAGGTGKTPLSLLLADIVEEMGLKPNYLSRGYGGALIGPEYVDMKKHQVKHSGDEPWLLARRAPTVISRNRAEGGALIDIQTGGTGSVIILDDAHQNGQLKKDMSIVVVDGAVGWGNGHVIPAGPLREPITEGLKRTDLVVIMGEDKTGIKDSLPKGLPALQAKLVLDEATLKTLSHGPLLAFAGIGRPEKFFDSLNAALPGHEIETRAYPDHYRYSVEEISALLRDARATGMVPVTTEKDWVRLDPGQQPHITALPVRVELDEAALKDIISARLG